MIHPGLMSLRFTVIATNHIIRSRFPVSELNNKPSGSTGAVGAEITFVNITYSLINMPFLDASLNFPHLECSLAQCLLSCSSLPEIILLNGKVTLFSVLPCTQDLQQFQH